MKKLGALVSPGTLLRGRGLLLCDFSSRKVRNLCICFSGKIFYYVICLWIICISGHSSLHISNFRLFIFVFILRLKLYGRNKGGIGALDSISLRGTSVKWSHSHDRKLYPVVLIFFWQVEICIHNSMFFLHVAPRDLGHIGLCLWSFKHSLFYIPFGRAKRLWGLECYWGSLLEGHADFFLF